MMATASRTWLISHAVMGCLVFLASCRTRERFGAVRGDLALVHVDVVSMVADGVLRDHTVIVRDGRIVFVGPSREANVDTATIVDGRGKWLIPGLADMHVHLWSSHDLDLLVAAGVTTVRNMFGSPLQLEWRRQIADGARIGPNIVTAGPVIDGEPAVWAGSTILAHPEDADGIVAAQKAQGYDFLKPYDRLSVNAYRALVVAARHHGMRLEGHVPDAVGLEEVIASNQHSIEHLDGLIPIRDELPAGSSANRADSLAAIVAKQIWICPTLVVFEQRAGLAARDRLEASIAWLENMSPAVRAQWAASRAPVPAEREAAVNRERRELVRTLTSAGARILVGTDAGNPYVVPGESLHQEIELLVRAGVSRRAVLEAATRGAAEFLGRAKDSGKVVVGARADLLLLPRNPLEHPLPLIPDGLVLRGHWHGHDDLVARAALDESDKQIDEARFAELMDGASPGATRFRLRSAGATVGEERVFATEPPDRRTTGQLVIDFAGSITVSYELAASSAKLSLKSSFASLAVDVVVRSGVAELTGVGPNGRPVHMTRTVPAGGVLTIQGATTAVTLADKVRDVEVGGRREVVVVELSYLPSLRLGVTTYQLERLDDRGGRRVFEFSVPGSASRKARSGFIELDGRGGVASYRIDTPLAVEIERIPDAGN